VLSLNFFAPGTDLTVMVWGLMVFVLDEVLVCFAIEAMHRYYRRYLTMVDELAVAREQAEAARLVAEDNQARADSANKAKSDFLAAMSHELRTPLNAIIGFADAIVSDVHHQAVPPRYLEYVHHIHDSGRHLLALINDVLDLSAIEAGRLELHPELISTGALVEGALRLVGPHAESKRLRLSTDLTCAPPNLVVDTRRVTQVLVNLLGNAVKFTPSRGRVAVCADALENGGIRFLVSDNGVGMDADGIRQALTSYGQVDNPISRSQGSGLGLPLTVRLVESLGGNMDIRSAPGTGTTICVSLPPGCVAAQPAEEAVA
jgi:signal transduction histidine kinase